MLFGSVLGVAGINGTILAIVIAAQSGYMLMVYQAVHRMQTELIERANATRLLPTSLGVLISGNVPWRGADAFEQLSDMFVALAWGQPPDGFPELPKPGEQKVLEPWEPEGEDTRGEDLLALMSQMPGHAPFAYKPEEDVHDLDGVQVWLGEVEERIELLANTLHGQYMTIHERVVEAEQRRAERFAQREVATVEEVKRSLADTRELRSERLADFESWVEDFRAGVGDVRSAVAALRRYQARALPSRGVALLVGVGVSTAFIGGVAIPVVYPGVSDVVYAWFPAVLYVSALVFGLAVIFLRYRRDPGDRQPTSL
jgi:hypothetical protein